MKQLPVVKYHIGFSEYGDSFLGADEDDHTAYLPWGNSGIYKYDSLEWAQTVQCHEDTENTVIRVSVNGELIPYKPVVQTPEALKADKERELDVWLQAYNAAITGLCAGNNCGHNTLPPRVLSIANATLDAYRAKREEMGLLRSEPRVDLDTTERNCFSLHQASKDCHGDGHYTCAKCARKIRGEG